MTLPNDERLDPSLKDDIDFIEMFRDEASLCLDFDHENIVRMSELIDDGEELAMVMELVDGPSLAVVRSAVEKLNGFGVDEALQIGIELCRALHHAHTRTRHGEPLHIVHRDVSPQNVMLTAEGRVKLGDSEWIAHGPDVAVGERVRVKGSEGAILLVEPLALLRDEGTRPAG